MSGKTGKYFYAQFMTFIVFLLVFTGELYKSQSNANKKENEQRNYQHFQPHATEHEQYYIHVSEHQTRQIRYTGDQLYKFDKSFYITKLNYTIVNTIKGLDIRQTFRTNRRRKEEWEEVEKMLEDGIQIRD